MRITFEYIKKKCSNINVFNKAMRLYNNVAVYDIDEYETDNATVIISAKVEGSSDYDYEVRAELLCKTTEEPLVSCGCECLAFSKYNGICKHVAALLMVYNRPIDEGKVQVDNNEEDDKDIIWNSKSQKISIDTLLQKTSRYKDIPQVINTSNEITSLMSYYAMRDRNEFCKKYSTGKVNLDVTLVASHDVVSFELRAGNKQKYVVKDMLEFINCIKEHRFFSYGRNLEFVHTQSAFSKEAQPIINLMIYAICNNDAEYVDKSANYMHISRSTSNRRNMKLQPYMLDEIMNIYEGKKIQLENNLTSGRKLFLVVREDPRISFDISAKEDESGAKISLPQIFFMEGITNGYMIWNNKLCIVSKEYMAQMKPFLLIMTDKNNLRANDTPFYNSYYGHAYNSRYKSNLVGGRYEYQLSNKDYAIFTTTILPIIKKYANVNIDKVDFEEYESYKPRYELSFDYTSGIIDETDKRYVICNAKVIYGGNTHNLIDLADIKETYRDLKSEYDIRTVIEGYFEYISEENKCFYMEDDEEKFLPFIEHGIDSLRQQVDIFISEAFSNIKVNKPPSVTAGIRLSGNLLNVSWNIADMKMSEVYSILSDYKKKKQYHRLKNGEFIRIDDNGMAVLSELTDGLQLTKKQLADGNIEVPLYRAMYLDLVMKENSNKINAKRDAEFKNLIKDVNALEEGDLEIPSIVNATLRPYQENGFQWIGMLAKYGFGGILADDMGLGKTLQVITFLASRIENFIEGEKLRCLIICPASLIYNWENEFYKFAPEIKVTNVLGNASERRHIINSIKDRGIYITSYDLLKRDIDLYTDKHFEYEIIDEAQYIKNASTQAAKAVKCVDSDFRLALTGTPIENSLGELWSIFDYLMPDYLYNYSKFSHEFEKSIIKDNDSEALTRLHRMIKPFIMRRLKKDVLKELPDKIEEVVYAKMDKNQEDVYKANEKKLIMELEGQSDKEYSGDRIEILAAITKLRQICCDPALAFENYKAGSAKTDTCIELIESAVSGGHRVLLFSQFTSMLDRLDARLKKVGITTFLLTGRTSKIERRSLVDNFQNGLADVFLISLKAGGTGLNLTAADIVIHFDPWWNVAAQNQATDRAHRIGQKSEVTVIKLIAKNTIEERILKLQEKKKDLADSIISNEGISFTKISREALLDFLTN